MTILVDCRHQQSVKQSGVGEYTIQLLYALFLIPSDHTYILLTTGKTKPNLEHIFSERVQKTFTFPPHVKHTHIPIPNKLFHLKLLFLKQPSLNWLIKEPVDLLFLPNLNITVLPTSIPTILTIHDISWHHFPTFFSFGMRLWHKLLKPQQLIEQAQDILCPSQTTKQHLVQAGFSTPEKIHAIPHGVSEKFNPKQEARDHGVRSSYKLPKRFALYVGTFEPRKNILTIIEGLKLYRDQNQDDIQLVLVGKWGWKSHQLRKRLWRSDVSAWVHVLEYVDQKDLPALYRSAHVFIWPSFYEGFGLPLLEAMASGTPVITSNVGSMPEITGYASLHIDPYNTQDLADALKGLFGSQSLQDQLKKAGLERASQLTWEKAAKATLSVFEKPLK